MLNYIELRNQDATILEAEQKQEITDIRSAVAALCANYGEDYWRKLDAKNAYPTEFVAEMTKSGFFTALIPEEYGGLGLGLLEACAILEENSFRGAHAGVCHAQMYVMGSLLRHGSEAQKIKYLPQIWPCKRTVGRSGPLCFVTVGHNYYADKTLCFS